MLSPFISAQALSLAYRKETIFSELFFTLQPNTWTALLGQSGIGKSSLLRLLANLTSQEETSSGHITCDNGLPLEEQVAYMAQSDLLLPWLSILENTVIGFKLRKYDKEVLKKAKSLLHAVGLSEVENAYAHQLSGGMRQRVAIVRTLMENKPVVLMDEPFSALDTVTRYQLHELAKNLLINKTVLFITHDPHEALRLADDIYLMQGKPANIQLVAKLDSPTPREFDHPEVLKLHPELLKALLKVQEVSS